MRPFLSDTQWASGVHEVSCAYRVHVSRGLPPPALNAIACTCELMKPETAALLYKIVAMLQKRAQSISVASKDLDPDHRSSQIRRANAYSDVAFLLELIDPDQWTAKHALYERVKAWISSNYTGPMPDLIA